MEAKEKVREREGGKEGRDRANGAGGGKESLRGFMTLFPWSRYSL